MRRKVFETQRTNHLLTLSRNPVTREDIDMKEYARFVNSFALVETHCFPTLWSRLPSSSQIYTVVRVQAGDEKFLFTL